MLRCALVVILSCYGTFDIVYAVTLNILVIYVQNNQHLGLAALWNGGPEPEPQALTDDLNMTPTSGINYT